MYKDKEKQKAANRKASKRYRNKGITQGMTAEGLTSYPDILDKLTDKKKWRPALEKICASFHNSHHPDYAHDVKLGVYGQDMTTACELLEVTG